MGSLKLGEILILISMLVCVQCTKDVDKLNEALILAGTNRIELEKVLNKYSESPEDSLKYKAAVFLIENMPGYGYYEGGELDKFLEYYPLLRSIRDKKGTPEDAVDSIHRMYGSFDLNKLIYRNDIETLDSAYLCNNIEWSFKVWREQPWGSSITFDDFCEYILPYRIANERPIEWKESYFTKYNGILNDFRQDDNPDKFNPVAAAKIITDSLSSSKKIYFTSFTPSGDIPHIGPTAAEYRSGSCRDLVDFVVYLCRALGIPATSDYMPLRGEDNQGHMWAVFLGNEGERMCQDMGNHTVPQEEMRRLRKMKVYRNTFSINEHLQKVVNYDSNRADFLREPRFKDVTYEYAEQYYKKLRIPSSELYNIRSRQSITYLCMSSRLSWIPVAVGKLTRDGAEFESIDGNNQGMRIASIVNGELQFISDPFYITSTGDLHFYRVSGTLPEMILFRKFSKLQDTWLLKRMVGGVFEGSNDANFLNKDTLHIIQRQASRLLVPVVVKNNGPYRYVRYYGPKNGFCNISDMYFYDKDGNKLSGRLIGTPGSYNGDKKHDYWSAVDGTPETSFDSKIAYGSWVGLDFGHPEYIEKIIYSPRCRDNFIRPGDKYELFYCDTIWKSVGQVVADSDSLLYKDIPQNTIYLLNNLTRGNQVRMFAYNNEQIWLHPEEILE